MVWPTRNEAILPPPSEAAVLGQAQWDVIEAFASSEEVGGHKNIPGIISESSLIRK